MGTWRRGEYKEQGNGQVGLRKREVTIRYVVICFLMESFEHGLKPFLLKLLRKDKLEFEPQRLKITIPGSAIRRK
jgi:hypothetical protein